MGNILPLSFCRIFLRHTYKSFSVPCLDHMKLLDCQYVLQTNGYICLKCIASLYRIYTQIVIQLFLSPTALTLMVFALDVKTSTAIPTISLSSFLSKGLSIHIAS